MSDDNEKNPEHQPPPAVDRPAADPVPATNQPAPSGRRFRDRVLGVRAVAAVALASLILGGVGGAAIVAVSDDGNHFDRHGGRDGRHGPFLGGPQLQPGGVPGQLPPATTPEDDGQDDSSQTG